METMSVSVSTAVVAIVSIGGSFSLTLVDLRDTVAGSGGVYALERGSSGDGIIKGSIGSKELRFGISFGLTLVVSVSSVSAVGVSTIVSTVVSTVSKTISVSVSTAVVAIVGISCGFSLSFSLGGGISHGG